MNILQPTFHDPSSRAADRRLPRSRGSIPARTAVAALGWYALSCILLLPHTKGAEDCCAAGPAKPAASVRARIVPSLAGLDQPPPVTFSAQPEEGGKLVYLPVAAESASLSRSALFSVRLTMANSGASDVVLTSIRLIFTTADNAVFARQFTRDLVIPAGKSVTDYLSPKDPDERIRFAQTAPVSVRIELSCEGYDLPRTIERGLAPYESPAEDGKYLFPANADDLGPDQYFSHIDPHTGGGQFFGYDFHVQDWNGQNFSSVKAGADSSRNDSRVGWGVPIYAMADGVVMHVRKDRDDNPIPGQRVIQRQGDQSAEAISDVKVTRLSDERAVTIVRRASGALAVRVWRLGDDGREIDPGASTVGESVNEIASDALTSSRFITAVRTSGNILRVIAWDTDGTNITRRGERDSSAVEEVSMIKLSTSRFATAARLTDDTLRLTVWDVSANGMTLTPVGNASAGVSSSISLVTLGETRLVTSLRISSGSLRVIVWDVASGGTLSRNGEATGDSITKALSVGLSSTQLATSMRTAAGDLKVVQWLVSEDGDTVTQERSATAGAIQDLAAPVEMFETSVLTPILTQDGNLKNILWRQPSDSEQTTLLYRFGEADAGPANRVSADATDTSVFFSGVRDSGGLLKVITWWIGSGGGNNVVLLHGNCRVLYAHFRAGSVSSAITARGDRVTAGQYLGRMGNSGSSSGPHTHIHCDRVSSLLTVDEILEQEANGTLTLQGYRPLPFHCARAMRMSGIKPGGEGANAFTTLSGHGLYFVPFGIRPTWLKDMYVDRSSTCISPTGRKDCVDIGPLNISGPLKTVGQALNESCWAGRLFIRAGSYNESVIFNRSMTVRSYDGTALIGQ